MKISKVRIKNLQQFQDLELDLTYPQGHEKAGQPLDKVCIIGQSGTGKTTLLKLLKEITAISATSTGFRMETHYDYSTNSEIEVRFDSEVLSYVATIENEMHYANPYFTKTPPLVKHVSFTDKRTGRTLDTSRINGELDREQYSLLYKGVRLMNFPLGFRYGAKRNHESEHHGPAVVDYANSDIWDLWGDMREALELHRSELTAKVLGALEAKNGERDRLLSDIDRWKEENPNMLAHIGRQLNPILERFFLRVNDDVADMEVLNRFRFIPLSHTKTGKLVPYSLLNSGSFNVTLIASALYFYKPEDAIVLIDEVENSLYPDVQEEIVNDYIKIAPSNQYFFTTHSPLVASSFDPWEIIELKFDEDGSIYQDNYLKDVSRGRHVDNYKFNPKLMSWSSIIARIYDLEKDGPDARQEALSHLAYLEEEMKTEKSKTGKVDKEALEKFIKLGEDLDWRK